MDVFSFGWRARSRETPPYADLISPVYLGSARTLISLLLLNSKSPQGLLSFPLPAQTQLHQMEIRVVPLFIMWQFKRRDCFSFYWKRKWWRFTVHSLCSHVFKASLISLLLKCEGLLTYTLALFKVILLDLWVYCFSPAPFEASLIGCLSNHLKQSLQRRFQI